MIKAELDQLFGEQKQIRTALEESERKYRELFEKGSDLLFFHDLEGNLLESRPAFQRGPGRLRGADTGTNVRNLLAKGSRSDFDDNMARLTQNGRDVEIAAFESAEGRQIVLGNTELALDMAPRASKSSSRSPRTTSRRLKTELPWISPREMKPYCSSMISRKRALKLGIAEFMEKPLAKKDLARALRKVLDKPPA